MLNFLQQKNKNTIIFEYLLRVTIFLLVIILISVLVLISLFLPSFFFAKYKNNIISGQLESIQQKNIDKGEDPVAYIKNVNRLSTILSGGTNKTIRYRDIIDKIVSFKNKDIKILSISITQEKVLNSKKILINGIANTRNSLTLFDRDIRTDGFFSKVTFPISDFIKGSDSEFSATLII